MDILGFRVMWGLEEFGFLEMWVFFQVSRMLGGFVGFPS
jgi:hypothetical protein